MIINIYLIILLSSIIFILNEEINNNTDTPKETELKGVYRINFIKNGDSLIINNDNLELSNKKDGKEIHFRIIPTNFNSYIIESKYFNKIIGINTSNKIKLLDKKENTQIEEKDIYWNIIQIKDNEYLI